MAQVGYPEPARSIPRLVVVAALVATAIKLTLAARTYGTNDVRTFWFFLQEYRGSGARVLYEKDGDFNHPPFILHLLTAIRWLWATTGIDPWFLIRLPSILADLGSVWLVAKLFESRVAEPSIRTGLVLVAAAPASILISGFHGNNDPVMIFFVLLSIFLLERSAPIWLAGVAMGMAINIKVVPFVFWPAIFLWLSSWRRRTEYFGAAVAVIVLASSPLIFQEPALLAHKVLGYSSSYGLWGLARILSSSSAFESISAAFASQGKWLLVATLVALSVWMNRGSRRPALFRQIAALMFAFLVITPGFGVQYLAWLVPWIAGAAVSTAAAWCLASGAFLVLVYTYWCQGVPTGEANPDWLAPEFWTRGLPWGYADAQTIHAWWGRIVPVEILCWLTVVAVFVAQLRAVARERRGVLT